MHSVGPIFGAGADLQIANNCHSNMDSYSNLPHSYDGKNDANCNTLFGDYNFSLIEYEVYMPTTNSDVTNNNYNNNINNKFMK